MYKNLLIFSVVLFFCFLALPTHANMPNPIYLEAERQGVQFDQGFGVFNHQDFLGDLKLAFISFLLEFFIFSIFLFKNDLFKIKNILLVFVVDMVTWLTFLGSTIISIWYLFYLLNPSILLFHPLNTYNMGALLVAELIILIIEIFAFSLLFRKEYSLKRIIIVTIVANLFSLIIPFVFV